MTKTATDEHVEALKKTPLDELPGLGGWSRCPTCDHSLVPEDFDPSYEEIEKLRTWTLGQLMAFRMLQGRSGIGFRELLKSTTAAGTERPGIGGALYGSGGLVAVTNFHGMFVGIEPDGYTHS